jgi:tetrathionate reductase subunit A
MSEKSKIEESDSRISRRNFLKASAVVGGGAVAFLGGLPQFQRVISLSSATTSEGYPLADPFNQIYTVCLQCNTGCGIKVKLLDGVAAKIDGNPYSPWTLWPHLPYDTPAQRDGRRGRGASAPRDRPAAIGL